MKTQTKNICDNYKVTFSPTDQQLAEIEKWLIEEDKRTKGGFYCNWKIIKSSFEDNELATISINDKTVGFATWSIITEKTARIEIAEIKLTYRKKGIGKKLTEQLINYLKEQSICVIELQCAPAESEPIWKRLGFIEFPEQPEKYKFNSDGNKKLYKILTDHLQQSSTLKNNETIELWNDEPYRVNEMTPPTNIWNVEFKDDTRKLSKPIIYPASDDWRIRWKNKGKTIKDEKVKRFPTEIDFGSFIIIDQLPH